MDLTWKYAIIVMLQIICCRADCEVETINTKLGRVYGTCNETRLQRHYYAFRRIPYAKPPIGNLRFKPPEEMTPWEDVKGSGTSAPNCVQKNYLFKDAPIEGSEDCLYLNVYARKMNSDKLFPVMVFIHWGGFFAGYSSDDYLGPEYFMDEDIILVTFNYRLGIFGFLSTSSDEAPGNYGLKDQVAALKWVRDNIEYFGGDKNKVTIFGQSAGGASVHLHMLSPLSKGLFHHAISQSGTALALWAKPFGKFQFQIALKQAMLVGCNVTSAQEIVDCLRATDANRLLESGDRMKYFSIDPLTVYLPSIETKTTLNPEPFITKNPIEYIRNNEFYQVPWIVGTVESEGLVRAAAILRQSETINKLNKRFDELMPRLMALQLSTLPNEISSLWKKLRVYYFRNQSHIEVHDKMMIKSFIDLYSERSFKYSAYQAALFQHLKSDQPIWFYNFNYKGQYTYGNVFAATNEYINFNFGVSHCDELLYLFKSPALFPDKLCAEDETFSESFVKIWTDFATNGKPSDFWLPLSNKKQKPMSKLIDHLNFDGHHVRRETNVLPYMKNDYYFTNGLNFWEETPLFENIPELNETTIKL